MNKTEQMNKNLYDYIRMHAQKAPQSAFLIGESSYTYVEALQRIQALMNMFAANGVKTAKDLTALLSKWQEEALQEPAYRRKPRMELRHERKRKRTSYAYER